MATPGVPVAVLGVGRMGLPISRRLQELGPVTVFDVDPDRRSLAAETGLTVAASAVDAVASARLVLTVLPGSPELEELMGEGGAVLAALPPGCTWIDMTSSAPALARTLSAAAADRGVSTLDAPMGGGPVAAASGDLTLYVGGEETVLDAWTPTLARLATTVHHVGGSGSGCLVKLLVNLLWFGQAALTAEAALLAAASGIDARRLRNILQTGPAASRFLERDFPRALAGDYLTTFGLDRIVEELDSVAGEAAAVGLPAALIDAVTAAHREALQQLGPVDAELAVIAHLEARAGRKL